MWVTVGELLLKRHTNPLSQISKKIRLEAYTEQSFYQMWPNIFHALTGKSTEEEIMDIFHAPSGKTINIIEAIGSEQPIRLSWTHYRVILQVEDTEARS